MAEKQLNELKKGEKERSSGLQATAVFSQVTGPGVLRVC